MATFNEIIWVKNVKRGKGIGWAYDDVSFDKPFLLNWPTSKKGSADTPKIGDVILLFQKPNFVNDKKNSKVFLTHLVSPITSNKVFDERYPDYAWAREVQLIAMANPIESIPNPGYFNFFKPNRGLTNPIINLTNTIGLDESQTKERIWSLFSQYLSTNLKDETIDIEDILNIAGVIEGDKYIKSHIKQEISKRNRDIIEIAKSTGLNKGKGHILCECCGFDFLRTYGILGTKFIECHHKIPISKGERITNIQDLALVCSNCHRMLHRKTSSGIYHSIESLRILIQTK